MYLTVLAADNNSNSTTTSLPPPRHGGASLAWVAAPVLLLVIAAVSVLCGVWFRWLYTAGERRYWGRVHNEHLRAAGSGASTSSARQEDIGTSERHQGRDSSEETDESMDNDRRGLFSWNV